MSKEVHVCMFSGGASSAVLARHMIEQKLHPTLLFTDTLWEDEDCYRFIDEVVAFFRAQYPDGFTYERVADGRTPLGLFSDEGILGSNRVPICSRVLKSEQTAKWIKQQRKAGITPILYFGITLLEAHRADRIKARYESVGVECRFPLLLVLPKEPAHKIVASWGVEPPRMYSLGFKHANCGGRCVRGKARHWLHLLSVWPERYAEVEAYEKQFKGGRFTILPDESLQQLRERADKQGNLFETAEEGGCLVCVD